MNKSVRRFAVTAMSGLLIAGSVAFGGVVPAHAEGNVAEYFSTYEKCATRRSLISTLQGYTVLSYCARTSDGRYAFQYRTRV